MVGGGNTYTIQITDVGYGVYCVVTASNLCSSIDNTSATTSIVPAPYTYLFDTFATYGVTPRMACSFRKLNSAYAGACCRIRRSNDNAETDIGFVNNVVDTASIQAFVPIGASGQIVYIYDQSGNNRHRYQSIANRQPDIIDSFGVIKTFNGKVVTHLNNATRMLQSSIFPITTIANYSFFNVYNETNTSANILYVGGTNQYAYVSQFGNSASAYSYLGTTLNLINNIATTLSLRSQCYSALVNKGNFISHYSNFSLDPSWGTANFAFGGYQNTGGGFDWQGYYAEEIFCDGYQVSNSALCTAIFSNQQSYYTL